MLCGWEGNRRPGGKSESNGNLRPGGWRTVTCWLTACTPGSAPGPTFYNEYGKPLPFLVRVQCCYRQYRDVFGNRTSLLSTTAYGPTCTCMDGEALGTVVVWTWRSLSHGQSKDRAVLITRPLAILMNICVASACCRSYRRLLKTKDWKILDLICEGPFTK